MNLLREYGEENSSLAEAVLARLTVLCSPHNGAAAISREAAEEVCEYVIEDVPERPQLSHYDTVVRGVKTTVPVLDCAQEVVMWDAFAALVVQRNRTAYYDVAMLTAHRIMDALQESGAKKGAWGEVK